MQDEINQRVVALVVRMGSKGGRMTTDVLKSALRKYLRQQETKKQTKNEIHRQKKIKKAMEPKHGKQTIGELMDQNQGLSNIEITDQNIKSFERVANKYHVDFALKKDRSSDLAKYVVFFKARDVDVMTAAFKEYSAIELTKSKKPSIRQKIQLAKAMIMERDKAQSKDHMRQKNRSKGQDR
ncbi:MAG: PcfB family protein [Eubacterium sp.]|nr:PcfB family protein [Eubacterium sp.]